MNHGKFIPTTSERYQIMKIILFAVLGVSLSISSWAQAKNPLMRVCRQEQGLFWAVDIAQDQVGLCLFGEAGIGAQDLLDLKTAGSQSKALHAYVATLVNQQTPSVCDSVSAQRVEGVDSNNQVFALCLFSDNSLIEENTLARGPGAPENKKLDQALFGQ